MAFMPNNLAGGAVNWLLPIGAVFEQDAGQHKGASASVMEIQICVPIESLFLTRFYAFVPAEVAQGASRIEIPMKPLPAFRGIGNRGVEYQLHNVLAADIFDLDSDNRRVDVNNLHRTRYGCAGGGLCRLRIYKMGKQEKSGQKARNLLPVHLPPLFRQLARV
jgi:hypothetical protein